MESVCAALLASYFSNVDLGAVDRAKLYAVPASMVAQMSLPRRATAKACAAHYGVRYIVVEDGAIPVRQ